jgi:hypothetical protein
MIIFIWHHPHVCAKLPLAYESYLFSPYAPPAARWYWSQLSSTPPPHSIWLVTTCTAPTSLNFHSHAIAFPSTSPPTIPHTDDDPPPASAISPTIPSAELNHSYALLLQSALDFSLLLTNITCDRVLLELVKVILTPLICTSPPTLFVLSPIVPGEIKGRFRSASQTYINKSSTWVLVKL